MDRVSACEFDHPHPGQPCGHRLPEPGMPCNFCGKPVPMGDSPCPDCWVDVATIPHADLKGMFADVGLSLDLTSRDVP